MPIATKRLGAPPAPSDGTRILVTRYRPRAVRRGAETWAEWDQRLAPSVGLLDLCFGKERASGRVVSGARPPIAWAEFVRRFRAEMRAPAAQEALAELRVRARTETVTLLCYCADETRCHRSLLAALLAAPPS
jgi:uncharacterized protein YeaO (DUF488 family)